MEKQDIKSLTLEELTEAFRQMGDKPFRAKQIYQWLHQKRVTDFDEMSNLSKPLREKLKEQLLDTFGESYGIFRNQAYVDMVGKDCSKGSGLKKILEIENWDVNNLYTIGDSYNDISMFEITDNSFTFNHVEDFVKAHANHTVDFVHECIDIILNS